MMTVVAIDPGLATMGVVVATTNGKAFLVKQVSVLTTESRSHMWGPKMVDDLDRRAREIARGLSLILSQWRPRLAVKESMAVFDNVKAQIYMSMGCGVIASELERLLIPCVSAPPRTWRKAVCGESNEELAHVTAMREVPSYIQHEVKIVQDLRVHARDALGVMVWGKRTGIFKE